MKTQELTGIERLRAAVSTLNYCNEGFNQQFSAVELLKIHDALTRCGWDIFPDKWEPKQIRQALRGKVPRWTEVNGRLKADYSKPKGEAA